MEPSKVVKDPRFPEIAWLVVIAILIAVGAAPVLRFLALNRLAGGLVLAVVVLGTVVAIRRAYVPASPTVRADVTKAVAYCTAALLGLVTVVWNPHWAIRACITAAEVAVLFDVLTIATRPQAAGER